VNEEIVMSAERIAHKFEGELAIDLQLMKESADSEQPNRDSEEGVDAMDEEEAVDAVTEEERARVGEIAGLLREEEEKGVAGRMATFGRLVSLWSEATGQSA
jgi:hypothetical protein